MAMDQDNRASGWHATTILMVRKNGRVVIGGDGQVSLGQTVIKGNARKVRRLATGMSSQALPARRRMPSRCSSGSSEAGALSAPVDPCLRRNSPRTGGRIAIFAVSRR